MHVLLPDAGTDPGGAAWPLHALQRPLRKDRGRRHRGRSSRRRLGRALGALVLALLLSASVLSATVAASPVPGWRQPSPPSDFARTMGYQPGMVTLADGTVRFTKPTGSCSGLWAGQPFGFTAVCQVHDYGYDLLRHAAATAAPLPPSTRQAMDAQFGHDLRAHCDATQAGPAATACHGLARLSVAGVTVNSWRQRFGPPVAEPVGAWVLGGLAAATAAGVAAGRRRVVESERGPSSTIRPPLPGRPTVTSPEQAASTCDDDGILRVPPVPGDALAS